MAEREKGVETMPCPNCGTDRPVSPQPDGSKSVEACPKCYPAPAPEKAAAPTPAREAGTDIPKES
jgi:hypothetical protein